MVEHRKTLPQHHRSNEVGPSGSRVGSDRDRFEATVIRNRPICREHYLLRLQIPPGLFPPTHPGQFVQLGCRPPDTAADFTALMGRTFAADPGRSLTLGQPELCKQLSLLRRPFSLAGRGDNEQGTWIDIIHRVIGAGTQWLSTLQESDAVDLIGPLGNWFSLPKEKSIALLVGGGVGLPPMFYLAQQLAQTGYQAIAFVGAASRDLLAVKLELNQIADPSGLPTHCTVEFGHNNFPTVITTDDGTCGLRGLITDGLRGQLDRMDHQALEHTIVYTCGPEAMMRTVAELAATYGVACQVCLEQAMACGLGTCQSCIVRIEQPHSSYKTAENSRPWRYLLACTDGPVFPAETVVW